MEDKIMLQIAVDSGIVGGIDMTIDLLNRAMLDGVSFHDALELIRKTSRIFKEKHPEIVVSE